MAQIFIFISIAHLKGLCIDVYLGRRVIELLIRIIIWCMYVSYDICDA